MMDLMFASRVSLELVSNSRESPDDDTPPYKPMLYLSDLSATKAFWKWTLTIIVLNNLRNSAQPFAQLFVKTLSTNLPSLHFTSHANILWSA